MQIDISKIGSVDKKKVLLISMMAKLDILNNESKLYKSDKKHQCDNRYIYKKNKYTK